MEPTPEQQEKWELQQIKQGHSHLYARSIASHVRELLSQRGYSNVQVVQDLRETWEAIVGERLAATTRLGKIHRRALIVEVNSSQACQELHFQQRRILQQLKERLPAQKISRLRVTVVNF